MSFVGEDNIPLIRVINGSEEENHYIIKRDDVWELATPKNVASFNYQDSDTEGLFFLTNFEAANYRLVKVLFTGEILEIIPETALALKSVSILEDFIITNSINTDMNSFIEFHSKDGELLNHKIPNDIQGTLSSFSMHKEKLRFSVSNFINPTKYIDLDLDTLDYTIV